MTKNSDVRWHQRFDNYLKALSRLDEAMGILKARSLSHLEQQGFIKAFEFTHELAWNVIKDFAVYQGETQIMGSRDATRYAFKLGIIKNGDVWMEMIKNRSKAVHTYDEAMANNVITKTVVEFHPLFHDFKLTMQNLKNAE